MISAKNCTLNQMIACQFEGDYNVLFENAPPEAWEAIYAEYIDLSGLAATSEYELIKTVFNLETRLRAVPEYAKVVVGCVNSFGKLYAPAVQKLAKYGYKVPDDPQKAVEYLQTALSKEKRFEHDLKAASASLDKLRAMKTEQHNDVKRQRRQFIQEINSLGTIYRIDRDKTTVEEYALMKREQMERIQEEQINNKFKNK